MAERLTTREVRELAFAFVCGAMGVTRRELLSHRRQPHLVEARTLFVWLVRTHGPDTISYPMIAEWIGDRDHTSIMHLFKVKAPLLLERNSNFAILCDRFDDWLNTIEEKYRVITCG